MQDLIFKSIKWFFFTSFFVAGLGFLSYTSTYGIRWAFLAIFSFGVVYWMSNVWSDMPKQIMVITVVFVAALGLIARLVPMVVYMFTDNILDQHIFFYWIGLLLIPGIPVIFTVFKYLD